VAPPEAGHDWLALGHTAFVEPWIDPHLHHHGIAEEAFLVLHGELHLWVDDTKVVVKPWELVLIRPGVPHAVVGGVPPIEHLGLRAPALRDKETAGEIPKLLPEPTEEDTRELRADWGYRIPLAENRNRNCWLLGYGSARFASDHVILAHVDFRTGGPRPSRDPHRHRMHLHAQSWEYYVAIEGGQTLRLEDDVVPVNGGEILAVPPGVRHVLHSREARYRGLTIRVPVLGSDDKLED